MQRQNPKLWLFFHFVLLFNCLIKTIQKQFSTWRDFCGHCDQNWHIFQLKYRVEGIIEFEYSIFSRHFFGSIERPPFSLRRTKYPIFVVVDPYIHRNLLVICFPRRMQGGLSSGLRISKTALFRHHLFSSCF